MSHHQAILATVKGLLTHKALRNDAAATLLAIGAKLPDAVVLGECLPALCIAFEQLNLMCRKSVRLSE
jgi:hypothetical protein